MMSDRKNPITLISLIYQFHDQTVNQLLVSERLWPFGMPMSENGQQVSVFGQYPITIHQFMRFAIKKDFAPLQHGFNMVSGIAALDISKHRKFRDFGAARIGLAQAA